MTKPLCIYHGNCADGFAAAWAVRSVWGDDMDYYPATHGDAPPDVTGRPVLMVDFSYKRPVIEQMAGQAAGMLILDHHKSAVEDLGGFPEPERHAPLYAGIPISGVNAIFDMERSGARIAWDYYHPGQKPPQLLLHVEDRDLWRFALPHTREIQAAVFSYPYEFDTWEKLMRETPLETLIAAGQAIERKHHKDIAELVKVCERAMTIAGHCVPVASLPYTLTSDAGHLMCSGLLDPAQGYPAFAACYWDTPGGRVFSLRSDDRYGGADVSAIATQYGGGGHKNAAGFKVPRDHELAQA